MGNGKTADRVGISSLIRLPKDNSKIDPDQLLAFAREERRESFCREKQDRLALYYAGLAGAIAARYARKWPAKRDDILGVAEMAMLETLDRALGTELSHIRISRLIHVRVAGEIKNFLNSDYVVVPPHKSSWFRKMLKELGSTEVYESYYKTIDFDDLVQAMESDEDNLPCDKNLLVQLSVYQPEESLIGSCLYHPAIDSTEREIILLDLAGHSDVEIGKILKQSPSNIGKTKKKVLIRLRCILTGDWSSMVNPDYRI